MKYRINLLFLLIGGVCLGWMIGMTKENIIVSVITTIITVLIAVVSYLSGLQNDEAKSTILRKTDSKPISILIIGLAIGGAFGIWTRTHNILGINEENQIGILGLHRDDINSIVDTYGRYIPDSLIYARLFDADFPPLAIANKGSSIPVNNEGVFYNLDEKFCTVICNSEIPLFELKQKRNNIFKIFEKSDLEQQLEIETQLSRKCRCNIKL